MLESKFSSKNLLLEPRPVVSIPVADELKLQIVNKLNTKLYNLKQLRYRTQQFIITMAVNTTFLNV